jgi:tripartite ATP-independent transporter DctP family solute receptor
MTAPRSAIVFGFLIGVVFSAVMFVTLVGSPSQMSNAQQGVSASAKQVTLKLGHALDTSHPVHKSMEFMKYKLLELSKGSMSVEIYPSGVLGSEVQSIEQLQQGALAMTKTSAAALESFVPNMQLFGLPYLFTDHSHFWRFLTSTTGNTLLNSALDKNLRGLAYLDAGSRNFYSSTKPIITPDDLVGMKVRVMNSKMAITMIEALGGSPTPIAWGELYSALAQGTVDAAENNPPSYVSNKHYEVSPHFSLDGHTRIPDVLLISEPIFSQLTNQQQTWLTQAAAQARDFQKTLWQQTNDEAIEEAKANGATVYHVDSEAFNNKAKSIYNTITDPILLNMVEAIEALK